MAVESKHTKISFPLPPVFFTVLWLIVQYSQAHRRAESIFTLKTEILLHTFSARLRHGLNSLQSKGNDQLGRLEKIFVKRWMPALILLVTLVQMHTITEAQGLNLALHVLVFPFSRSYSFRTHLKSVSYVWRLITLWLWEHLEDAWTIVWLTSTHCTQPWHCQRHHCIYFMITPWLVCWTR